MGFNSGNVPDGDSTVGGVHVCESYQNKDFCGD
jgi:hypothetical protein